MLRRILVVLYHSLFGKALATLWNGVFSFLNKPRMLWGYSDASGAWRSKTRISNTVSFYKKNNMCIGDNVYVGHYCILDGTGKLELGTGCQISARSAIYTHSSHIAIRLYGHHYTEIDASLMKGFSIAPVILGDYVYIGSNVTILPGVSIGPGALVAAGAVVKENVDAFQCVAGCPARVIGTTTELDKAYLSDPEIKKWYDDWQQN